MKSFVGYLNNMSRNMIFGAFSAEKSSKEQTRRKSLWCERPFELKIGVHVAGQHVYECRVRSFLKSHFFETYFATTLFFCTLFWAQMAYIGNSGKMADTFIQICIGADFRVVIEWRTRAEADYHVISEFYKRGNELRHAFVSEICEFCLTLGDLRWKSKTGETFMM